MLAPGSEPFFRASISGLYDLCPGLSAKEDSTQKNTKGRVGHSLSQGHPIKCDRLGSLGLPSVKFNLLLHRLNMSDLVGEVGLIFYQDV
jgi:hypothetical protein